MKRNESVLVYGVTGLLLVILLVAVIFGEQPANAGEPKAGPNLAQLPSVTPALGDDGVTGDPKANDPNAKDDPAGAKTDQTDQEKPTEPVSLTTTVSTPISAEKRLENEFGTSSKVDGYRMVQAWHGDTLKKVVTRWCGSENHMPVVETLNETVNDHTLTKGQKIMVPWVEAEVLLAAEAARAARRADSRKKIRDVKGNLYVLRKGDSLWKVAKARGVPNNQIPAWLQKFKTINPEITDLGLLVEGQKILLPK